MSSKRLFSWSKRQSSAEPYYKTGGLLSIESIGNDPSSVTEAKVRVTAGDELAMRGDVVTAVAKDTQKTRRRPSNLTIIPPDHDQFTSSPLSSPYNAALVSSTSNLMAMFNDMLRSPALGAGAGPQSASVQNLPPTRPHSTSVPSTPDPPVELPGSLLQHNQGFPILEAREFAPSRPTSQNIRRGTHPPDRDWEDEGDVLDLLHLFPEPLNHSKSVPSLNIGYRESAMMSSRAGVGDAGTSSASVGYKSKPHRVHHRKALSDIKWRAVSDPISPYNNNAIAAWNALAPIYGAEQPLGEPEDLLQSPQEYSEILSLNRPGERRASRRDDLGASLTPTPTTAHSKVTGSSQTSTAQQDQTIATLRSQFRGLRASHEARVASLAEAHAAEVASLRDYTRLLEEQLVQRSGLHHDAATSADAPLASSNNPLFFLDTLESPSTLSRESSQYTASTSASSTPSYRNAPEKQQQSPARSKESPEMESLKRKLSTTRRPQTADRNLLPELNQYKQNNAALQTQISSLMAKLNESKKSEKTLKTSLQDIENRCTEAERKADEAQQLASSAQALQNTVDHLESRLEIANSEKLDAQEELFNMRALKSPFDARFPELQLPAQTAHESMDTVFSSDSDHRQESSATLSKFVAHVEQLQDEIRRKDEHVAELETDALHLQQMLDQMNQQCNEISLQLDIQNELLGRTKETDTQIEQLRVAVVDREAVIAEKEKSVRAVERQLEHHRLLLQAEIRKHATTSRYFTDKGNPLPELTALATTKDIDKWIERLNQRLKKEISMSPMKQSGNAHDALIEDLRKEIDFYVREIIYYKLDIRGYKSDIKKLNKVMAQLGSYGSRSDFESDTSSLRPAPTPSRTRFLATTPELRSSEHPSPAFGGLISANMSSTRAWTPPASATADSPNMSPSQPTMQTSDKNIESASKEPMTSRATTTAEMADEVNASTPLMLARNCTDSGTAGFVTCGFMSTEAPEDASRSTRDDDLASYGLGDSEPSYLRSIYLPSRLEDSRPILERDDSVASTVRPVIPTSRFSRDVLPRSPSPNPQHISHSRVGSGSSTLSYSLQNSSSATRPERKLSNASSTGIPFVIAMSSPHNPAIAVAAKNMPPIRSHRSTSATSRAGIDGTMASSTPLSSPTSMGSPSTVPSAPSPAPTGHKRKLSLSFKKQENDDPSTPTRSRSLSGGSIRTAIRWTKGNSKDKDREAQSRKDSIGLPQALDGPLVFGQETYSLGAESRVIDFTTPRRDNKA